jgi:AsmA protein
LIGGNPEDALKGLVGGTDPAAQSTDTSQQPQTAPAAAPQEQPKPTPEEKAKKKLNKLLGL